MSATRRLILPFIILAIALSTRQYMINYYDEYGQLFDWLPYLLITASMLLAIFFNLSRNFIASLYTLIAYQIIQTELQITLDDFSALHAYSSLCIVSPVLVLYLFFIPEKGLRNKFGFINLSLSILIMAMPIILRLFLNEQEITGYINSLLPIRPVDGYIQSINSSILFLLTFITGMVTLYKFNKDFISASLALLLILFITLSFFHIEKISTILFMAISIILISSSLRSSYNLAYRDELTGLLGRRALNDRLKILGRKYVIAMMDVDHFKKFNDTYGHDIGDDVLKMVANQLDSVKGGGITYRYGGEEFCIIFPGKIMEEAEPYLEDVRKTVENYQMVVRNLDHRPNSIEKGVERRGRRKQNRENQVVSVTISIGVAQRNETKQTSEETLKNADTALYSAKQSGRNCVILHKA